MFVNQCFEVCLRISHWKNMWSMAISDRQFSSQFDGNCWILVQCLVMIDCDEFGAQNVRTKLLWFNISWIILALKNKLEYEDYIIKGTLTNKW